MNKKIVLHCFSSAIAFYFYWDESQHSHDYTMVLNLGGSE